jgi:iron complex outermembrane receptor protein
MCVGNSISKVTENGRKNNLWYQDLTSQIISTKNTLFLKRYKIDLNAAYQMNNRRLQTDENMAAFEMVDMDMNTLSYEAKAYLPSTESSEYIIGIQGADKTNKNHRAPNHVIPNAHVSDFSVFGLVQKTFFDKLETQAGARYDYRYISTDAETNKDAVNKNFGNISGSLGATYRITESFLLRANLASAYRTPNIAELTENGMHGTRYEQGSSALRSQRNYEADLSAHYHSKYIIADISGFYNRINNYIYISPTSDSTASGSRIYRYLQTDSKIYGSELSVDIMPMDWLDVNTSYSYLIGKQDNGSYLPFIPQNKLKFEVTFKKRKMAFFRNPFFKIGGLYAAKQDNPAMFETKTDNYFLMNAGIGTEIKVENQIISLAIQANNILNETYIDHLSTLKDMGYNDIGRNISVNLKIPFGLK